VVALSGSGMISAPPSLNDVSPSCLEDTWVEC
jgi:hypothetical protein